jgi:hypothetical protein
MSIIAEIMGGQPPKKYAFDDVLVCHHVSLPEIELLQYEITQLKIGKEAMAEEIRRIRAELATERAAKKAILASWKCTLMRKISATRS